MYFRTCGFFVQFDDTACSVKTRNYELLDDLDSYLRQGDDGSREVYASGILDPHLPQFSLFNSPTGKGGLGCPCCNKTRRDFDNAVLPTCKYTTSVSAGLLYVRYALDVVFAGIESPVRFHLPVVCRVLGRTERFFYPNRKALHVNYIVSLKALVPVFIDLR